MSNIPQSEPIADSTIKVPSSIRLVCEQEDSREGSYVVFKATVISDPPATGTVTFWEGNENLGIAILNDSGIAMLSVSKLALGTHAITAQYSGDGRFSESTSATVLHKVNSGWESLHHRVQSVATILALIGAAAWGLYTFCVHRQDLDQAK